MHTRARAHASLTLLLAAASTAGPAAAAEPGPAPAPIAGSADDYRIRVSPDLVLSLLQPADAQPALEPEGPPPLPPPWVPQSFWKGWSGSVELGLNGSEGNSEVFNVHAGASAERKTPNMETRIAGVYKQARDSGEITEEKARLDLRNDWLTGTPWRYFAKGAVEYDDFQDWDVRLSAYVGVGYEFIKNDKTTFIGRLGVGASREIGGSDNAIHPEGLIGVDFEHKFTDTQKFTFTFDFYPDLKDIGAYRFEGKAAYEILLDPKSNLTFKVGVDDRYDSTPNGRKRNDLDYFALLVFKF